MQMARESNTYTISTKTQSIHAIEHVANRAGHPYRFDIQPGSQQREKEEGQEPTPSQYVPSILSGLI
jgi:hypothetical protein